MTTNLVAIGIIRRPVGLTGLLGVETLGDTFATLESPCRVYLGLSESGVQESIIESIEKRPQGFACRFKGYPDRTAAELLRNFVVYRDEADLPKLENGRFYHFELTGMAVIDESGNTLGSVIEVHNFPTTDTIEVGREKGEPFMVPMAGDAIKTIDRQARQITINRQFIEELLQ